MRVHSRNPSLSTAKKAALLALLLATSMNTHAAVTDLAPAPLITTPTASVLPNVFLMMDDSGSMAWDYMPDNAGNFNASTYGAASHQCNGVFYNPNITYTPPVDSTGASYPNSVFTAAWKDGYNTTTGGTVNLSTSFVDPGKDAAQAAFYYSYSGTQTTEKLKDYYSTTSTFYKECNSNVGSAPGNGVFTKVLVGAAEQTNFANWYSYYRTRILMMKTATGLAFKTIGNTFRVGMATMNNNTTADFLPLGIFDATQKAAWYAKLYATKTGSSTPLREALANVGRMYANKLPASNPDNALMNSSVTDPIEYSCQQNFTILTTDGFWNGATTYNLAGGTVGNQDGTEVRPMYDGSVQAKSTTQILRTDNQTRLSTSRDDKWTQQLQTQTSALQQQSGTLQWQTNLQQTAATLQWQTNLQKTTAPLQWQTNLQQTTAPLQWQTNLQKNTYQLAMWTNLQQVTAPLMISTATYTATVYRLTISSTSGGTYSNAATNTTYNCLASGVSSGNNKYCKLGAVQSTTTGLASCPSTYNNPGSSTTNGSRNVTVCSISGWSTPAAVGANASCTPSASVQCSTGTASAPTYVTNFPVPSCTVTYNAAATSTANASGQVVSACQTDGFAPSAKMSPATPVGTNNSCDWFAPNASNPNMWCDINLTTAATSYVSTYPPTCAPYSVVGGFVTADASGNVTTSCTVNAAYSAPTTVASGTSCNGALANVQCSTGAPATTSYVTTYPPSCATTFNGAAGNSTAIGTNVVTACSVNAAFSPATNVAAGGTCDGSGATPNVQCTTGAATTAYVTTYPPTCATNFNAVAANTADAAGKVTTACPVNAAFSAGTSVGANGTCDAAAPNVQCVGVSPVTSYLTTYPPTCAISTPVAGVLTADAGGKITTACPVNAAFGGWTNTAAAGSCTPGANINCQYAWGAWSNAASCTTNLSAGAGAWTITTGTQCQYAPFTAWSNYAATSCTPVAQSGASPFTVGTARNCQVINVTTPANTPANPAAAWVSLSPGTCAASPAGSPAGAIPVSGPFNASGLNVQCATVTTSPTPVSTCTNAAATALNNWTSTSCVTNTLLLGGLPQYNSTPVPSCTLGSSGIPNYVVTTCPAPITTGPTNTTNCIIDPATAANNWITTACSVVSGGTSDTLADVAEYYYMTDLRTPALGNNISGAPGVTLGTDISNNNVPPSGLDSATHQHMTTFTLGLGARGRMVFDPSYQSAPSGDFFSVKQGSTANSATGVCSWQANNTICDWPIPASNAIENVDDLWHAAVNGRGTYFSAANPADLSYGLTSALAGVSARRGSAAAATTSTAFITQGDNFMFHSSFVSLQWTGDLTRQQIDVVTGKVLPAIDWSAQTKLDLLATPSTSRNIVFYKGTSLNNLASFLWANLTPTQQSYFSLAQVQTFAQSCIPAGIAPCLSVADQSLAAGANMVNFIRGDVTNTGAMADNTKYYRQRLHLLGDIVNSESVYVKLATASYKDPGYNTFQTSTTVTTRKAMVYVGANDGMLHAFRAADDPSTPLVNEGGQEDWAYIPTFVIPNLYKLADKSYDQNALKHQYYVDGSPVSADVCVLNCSNAGTAVWKTILVGGLNFGGKGYYALDITDPATPKALWEFTDANMGYTYGNPKIAKLKDGTWVVLVTSGYNNVAPDAPLGDGQGHLYVLNANTGALIRNIATGAGTTITPSGLARIDVAVNSPGSDATILAAYGGDLLGNVWRFDVNGADTQVPARWADIGAAGFDAQLLATLRGPAPANNVQPVTSKPLLTLAGSNVMVIIGTGRYLGSSDLADTSQQSFYAMKDTFPTGTTPSVAIWGNPRTQGTFVQQLQYAGTCPPGVAASVCMPGSSVTLSTNRAVNLSSNGGWFFDFPRTGERVNTNPDIVYGTIVLGTNLPNSSSCSIGGESYVYFINYLTGGAPGAAFVPTSNLASNAGNLPTGWGSETWGVSGSKYGNETISNPNIIYLPDGTIKACFQGSGGGDPVCIDVPPPNPISVAPRRTSWRELTQ